MEAVVIAGMVATIAGAGYSAYSQHQQGKAANTAAKAAAAESERQAQLENERAGIAQIQGEQEAERRSRQLAQDIALIDGIFDVQRGEEVICIQVALFAIPIPSVRSI